MSGPYRVTSRDRVVRWVCNALLNHVATKDYRRYLNAVCYLGVVEFGDRVHALARNMEAK